MTLAKKRSQSKIPWSVIRVALSSIILLVFLFQSIIMAIQSDHVVINEYLANPASDWDDDGDLSPNGDEFIELYNPTENDIDISGWQLDDVEEGGTRPYTIPQGTVLPSKSFETFFGSETGVKLNNQGDEIRLIDSNGNMIDSVNYTSSIQDQSNTRLPDGEDFWTVAIAPTPNDPSSVNEIIPYRGLILVGKVVTMMSEEAVIQDGSILVRDGLIEAVWDNEAGIPDDVDIEGLITIETGGIIFPGLIDIHNHVHYNVFPLWKVPKLFTNRYDWTDEPTYKSDISWPKKILLEKKYEDLKVEVMKYSEVRALMGGTTAIQGSPGPRNAYNQILVRNVELRNFDQDRIYQNVRPVAGHDEDYILNNLVAQDKLDAYFVHLAEGTDQESRDEFTILKEKGLLIEELVIIHGTALRKADFSEMAAAGSKLVWSPLSNLLLYGNTTDVRTAWNSGVLVSLAPDWGPSGSKNLLGELKVADQWNKLHLDPPFTDYEIVQMATVNPALTIKWDDKVGRIQKGLHADILVIRDSGDDPYHALIEATDRDVLLVTVEGDPLYGRVDWMELLKPMDYEGVGCEGIVRGLDVTMDDVDMGDQTWAHITDVLEEAMTFTAWMDEEFPGLHQIPLPPILTSCDTSYFGALDASANLDPSLDLSTYYFSTVTDSDGDDIPDETDTDDDNDGLSDDKEARLGTDRLSPDTDGDRVSDSKDYFPLDDSKWMSEPDLVPYAVGGTLVAIAGGIWYYMRRQG